MSGVLESPCMSVLNPVCHLQWMSPGECPHKLPLKLTLWSIRQRALILSGVHGLCVGAILIIFYGWWNCTSGICTVSPHQGHWLVSVCIDSRVIHYSCSDHLLKPLYYHWDMRHRQISSSSQPWASQFCPGLHIHLQFSRGQWSASSPSLVNLIHDVDVGAFGDFLAV